MGSVIPKTEQKRIVIIGCGFAGIKLARSIKDKNLQVVLVDKLNYHQFQPLFYQVAASGIEPSAISFPVRKIFQKRENFFFRVAEVQSIDPQSKRLETSVGPIGYDYLVIAAGATTSYFGLENVEKHSFPMKTTTDSIVLRNHILQSLEDSLGMTDIAKRQALLNMVVIGGGPTGVEVSGAIGEMKNFVVPREYKEMNASEVRVTLIEAGPRILGPMSPKASMKATKYLNELGVIVGVNKQVVDYDGTTLKFADGTSIETNTVVWAAGVIGNSMPGIPAAKIGRGRRIQVNRYNQVEGLDGVYALGDIAMVTGDEKYPQGHPQVAPVAVQQASHLAQNILRAENGKPMKEFEYNNQGSMATVGRNRAVVDFGGFKYYGFWAWITWLFVHLMSIVGTKNRLIIFINWMWSYFTYDQSLRLIIRNENPRR